MTPSKWKINKRIMAKAKKAYDIKHTHVCNNPECTSIQMHRENIRLGHDKNQAWNTLNIKMSRSLD